ncbi:cytochrome P450 [Immersiella caudata]|uniref:Cytochrome P450 n=1 Tax=Immersiella caudata TaxID=314043 RepID=A0AA39U5X7_9PEZI|nr:cytochrome P450 [Immersiella caudata]
MLCLQPGPMVCIPKGKGAGHEGCNAGRVRPNEGALQPTRDTGPHFRGPPQTPHDCAVPGRASPYVYVCPSGTVKDVCRVIPIPSFHHIFLSHSPVAEDTVRQNEYWPPLFPAPRSRTKPLSPTPAPPARFSRIPLCRRDASLFPICSLSVSMLSLSTATAMAASASTYLTSLGQNATRTAHNLNLNFSLPFALPTSISPTYLLLSLLLLSRLALRVHRWYRLSHIPGPFLAGWTSLWNTYHNWNCDVHTTFLALTLKYGPLVRIGPNEVICTDVDEILRITHFKSGWRKDKWYKLGQMTPGVDSVFSTLDPELRREKKRKIMPAYAGKGVDSFEDSVDRGTSSLLRSMNKFAESGEPIDMSRQAHFFTLDTLGEVVYSTPMGYLKNNRDMGNFLKINEKILPIMLLLSSYESIFGLMHYWPLKYLMPREGDGVGAGAIMTYTRTLIDERFQPGAEEKRDMLQSFIRNGLDKTDILQEVTLQFFAGTDTTSNTITMVIYHLVTNPRAYKRLQKELDDATAAGRLSTPVKDSEVRQLEYLQACIREALRLMPPTTSTHFYKAAPLEGDTLCGSRLPFGTRMPTSPLIYTLGRMKSFWGEDVEQFRPERWIEADEERRQAMVTRVELVFGHGQFACLGKVLAWMEISKTVSELLRSFDVTVANPFKAMKAKSAMTWIMHDFVVNVEKREDLPPRTPTAT